MILNKDTYCPSIGSISSHSDGFSFDDFGDNEVVPTAEPLVDDSPTPAVVSESTEPSIDSSRWHTLSSLLPLFQLLPALKLQSHSYVLSGPITSANISLLCAHTKLVKTLSFTGISETTKEAETLHDDTYSPRGGKAPNPTPCPSISDSAFIRLLAHLPNGRLLPSLERVTIIDTAWAEFRHAYPVLLVPTLREIELHVSTHEEHLLIPLLSSLPSEVLGLQKLVLRARGGYRLPSEAVDAIASMNALCHLELDDIVDFRSVDLLKKIGQLPELTTFIMKDTAPTYSPSKESAEGRETGLKNLRNLSVTASFSLISDLLRYVESELASLKISPVVNGSYNENEARLEETARRCEEAHLEAQQAHAEAEAARIRAEEARVKAEEAAKVEREYLKSKTKTEVQVFPQVPPANFVYRGSIRSPSPQPPSRSPTRSPSTLRFPPQYIPSLVSSSRSRSRSRSIHRRYCPSPRRDYSPHHTHSTRRCRSPPRSPSVTRSFRSPRRPYSRSRSRTPPRSYSPGSHHSSRRPRSPRRTMQPLGVAQPTSLPHISWSKRLQDILQLIPTRWVHLQTLVLDVTDLTEKSRVFEIPGYYLQPLVQLKDLVTLQVENWKIMDCQTTLCTLLPSFQKMKKLILPLGRHSSFIPFNTLSTIKHSCPVLEELQVPISISISEDERDITEGRLGGLDTEHPLKSLSVGSPALWGPTIPKVKLARVLDTFFPRLERMKTHYDESQIVWNEVWELVRLCQDVREDERGRIRRSGRMNL